MSLLRDLPYLFSITPSVMEVNTKVGQVSWESCTALKSATRQRRRRLRPLVHWECICGKGVGVQGKWNRGRFGIGVNRRSRVWMEGGGKSGHACHGGLSNLIKTQAGVCRRLAAGAHLHAMLILQPPLRQQHQRIRSAVSVWPAQRQARKQTTVLLLTPRMF